MFDSESGSYSAAGFYGERWGIVFTPGCWNVVKWGSGKRAVIDMEVSEMVCDDFGDLVGV